MFSIGIMLFSPLHVFSAFFRLSSGNWLGQAVRLAQPLLSSKN